MLRFTTSLICVTACAVVFAQAPADKPADATESLRLKAAQQQEQLRRQFGGLQQAMLNLRDRLRATRKPDDAAKADAIQKALELAARDGVDNQFRKLVQSLTASGVTSREIESALGQNEQIVKTLREMLALLLADDAAGKNKDEEMRLRDVLKNVEQILREQKLERSKVEANRGDKDSLSKGQKRVTDKTKDLAKKFDPKKAGERKDLKDGDPKGAKPKDGDPKDAKPKDGDPKGAKPKDSKDSQQPPPGRPDDGEQKSQDGQKPPEQPPQPQDELPGRKQIQDAIENQKKAEQKLRDDERQRASKDQDEAIKKLEDVRKEIERRLRQMREEEMERLLAGLEARCRAMLALQIEVHESTRKLYALIEAGVDKKPTRDQDLKAGELSAKEGEIVVMCQKALELLMADGSAVAFPMVLEDARDQMRAVQNRLFKTDVGPFTQAMEEEIIASLKELVEALKKAQQDLKDRQQQQQQQQQQGQPPNPKLIDLLAELKMIRNLQWAVNKRTTDYGKQYPGEQAEDPDIRKELHTLAERQDKIHRVTRDIATGKPVGQ